MSGLVRRAVAELPGTFVLLFLAVGSAVFAPDLVGASGVALALEGPQEAGTEPCRAVRWADAPTR